MSPTSRFARAAVVPSLAALVWLGTAACAKKEGGTAGASAGATGAAATTPPTTPAGSSAAATPAGGPTLTDPQIAHVAVTANSIDSTAGELAKKKGSAKAVKDFAQTMITDHTGVNKQAVALAKKLNVTPEDNDISKQLKTAADQNIANLQGKSGADFDKAYIDNEVTYHQNVLDALDKTLIPQTKNAELKDLLTKVRPAVAAHLDRAKSVQAGLSGGAAGGGGAMKDTGAKKP